MSEAKVQTKILRYLEANDYWVIKVIVGNKKGIMDIIACSPTGRFVGIEVKFGSNKPSALQSYHIKEVVKRKGIAFVAYSLEDVKAKLI